MDAGQHVVLTGRIDARTAESVRDRLSAAIASGSGELSLDLSEASIGDLTGLGVIVGAYERARRADRRLVVVSMSPCVRQVLRRSRLERLLAPGADSRRPVAAVTA